MNDQPLSETFMKMVQEFGLLANARTPCGEDLSLSEAHALSLLQREHPLTQQELGQRLHLEKSTISRLVDTLEQKEWIVRQTSEEDRRQKQLYLTDSGTERAQSVDRARRERFETILDHIPSHKRTDLRENLETFLKALHEINDSPDEDDDS